MVGFIKIFERFSFSNPYSICVILLLAALIGLLWFTVTIDKSSSEGRDWRYFRNASIRNHLWILYFVLSILFLAATL
jgi:uncharacterized membrane protein